MIEKRLLPASSGSFLLISVAQPLLFGQSEEPRGMWALAGPFHGRDKVRDCGYAARHYGLRCCWRAHLWRWAVMRSMLPLPQMR